MILIPLFFIPYLSIYLGAVGLNLTPSFTRTLFWTLHLLWGVPYILALLAHHQETIRKEGWFWILVFLAFLIPGVYLEYPADPWEHLRRIYEWNHVTHLSDHSYWKRFGYFWGWTFLGKLSPTQRFGALDYYSASWQFLLALQFYIVMRRAFLMPRRWAWIQVIGCTLFLGTSLFTFRYYALAATIPAQIAYFSVIGLCVKSFQKKTLTPLWGLAIAFPIMAFNHPQTFIFLIPLVLAIGLVAIRKYSHRFSFWVVIGVMTFASGGILYHFFRGSYGNYDHFHPHLLTPWGGFRIWHSQLRILQTLALPGLFAILAALFLLRRGSLIAFFTLAPLLTLIWPPTAVLLAHYLAPDTVYRVLYAFPFSVALVECFRRLFENIPRWKSVAPYFVLFIILLLGIKRSYPWNGRVFQQFYRVPASLTFRQIAETSEWFMENPLHCPVLTDNITNVVLGVDHPTVFRDSEGSTRLHTGSTKILNELSRYPAKISAELIDRGYCGVLLANREVVKAQQGVGWLGPSSGHWGANAQTQSWFLVENPLEWETALRKATWTQITVPPYYTLWRTGNR